MYSTNKDAKGESEPFADLALAGMANAGGVRNPFIYIYGQNPAESCLIQPNKTFECQGTARLGGSEGLRVGRVGGRPRPIRFRIRCTTVRQGDGQGASESSRRGDCHLPLQRDFCCHSQPAWFWRNEVNMVERSFWHGGQKRQARGLYHQDVLPKFTLLRGDL
jgi:hypothetical protein